MARANGDARYLNNAKDLALAAHRGFVHKPFPGDLRMYWKMTVTFSRPLVSKSCFSLRGRGAPLSSLTPLLTTRLFLMSSYVCMPSYWILGLN